MDALGKVPEVDGPSESVLAIEDVFSEILYNKRIGKGENLHHNVPEHDVDVFPFVRDENGPE
jgi:hypothetical protein